jgi:NitT/TauT family transport system permease protein
MIKTQIAAGAALAIFLAMAPQASSQTPQSPQPSMDIRKSVYAPWSPDAMQLDLLRTYGASQGQTFAKLRMPASLPYLFASLKVGVAAALVGAIVGELPTGAVAGLGARLLSGSYYGQTVQIWAALFAAAVLAASLVAIIGLVERLTLRRMGMDR